MLDLLFMCLYALAGCAAVLAKLPIPPLRAALTLPMVLFIPGYALITLMFPRRMPKAVERVAMSLGLSLAVTVVSGLLLNWTVGVTESAWLVILMAIIWSACMVAAIRRLFADRLLTQPRRYKSLMSMRQFALFGMALVLAVTSVSLARYGEANQPNEPFTILSALRDDKNGARQVRIAIMNEEIETTDYFLEVLLNGKPVEQRIPVTVSAKAVYTYQLALSESTAGKVEAQLFKSEDSANSYRSVTLWLP